MMGRFENEILECEHHNPSDSESGMQPGCKEPDESVGMLCSPHNQHCMQLPLAGLIHICNTKRRRHILKSKAIYMSTRKMWVNPSRVRPGTKLFFFDFEDRMLWGTYEFTTFPHFLRRKGSDKQEDDLPYQIYFQLYRMFEPLEEEIFKHVIKENYFSPCRFRCGLSGDQVANLLALFHFHASYWCRKTHQIIQPRILKKRGFQTAHKFAAFGNESVSSCMQRDAQRKRVRKYKHSVQLDKAQIKSKAQLMVDRNMTNSTSPILQRKTSYSLKDELLQCSLKFGRVDNNTACFLESLGQDEGDSSGYTSVSLEDGEFVLPKDKETSFENMQYQKLQLNETPAPLEEVDGHCDAEFQTRNFIQILERSLASTSNTIHSGFLTARDGEIIEANSVDKVNTPAQLQHIDVEDNEACEGAEGIECKPKVGRHEAANEANNLAQSQRVGVKDSEACKRAVWIDDKGKGLLARTLGKQYTRTPSGEFSTDGGSKVKGSVWLRLADPRPMNTDEDACEPEKLPQCNFESTHYSTWKLERQRSSNFGDIGGYCTTVWKAPQETSANMHPKSHPGKLFHKV